MSFSFQGRKVTLKPLSPKEVHEDQIKMKTKRENEKAKKVSNKPSHHTLSTKSIMLTRAMPQLEPQMYSSSLSFSLPKVLTSTPSWLNNVRDDFFFIPPNVFHHLRGLFPKNIIIPKQFFPTWSIYRTSFSELPLLTNSKSCLPFSYSTVNFDSKLTLLYAGIQNSWTNSLQLMEYDEDQVEEDFTNGGRGHPPKHLKLFLLVFSKIKKKLNKERTKPKRRLQAFKNGLQFVRMYGFKLEGGEWFKEGFRKLLSQE